MENSPPILLTKHTQKRGVLGVVSETTTLRAAFERGEPVTLTGGKFAGERVYLGREEIVWRDDSASYTVIGLDREMGESPRYPGVHVAIYYLDTSRLDAAPGLAAAVQTAANRRTAVALATEQAAQEEDERWEREGDH